MVEYNKVNVKLSDSLLNKLKSVVKNQTRITLTMNIKLFEGNNLSHELLLTTRQKARLRHAFENNFSADIKLSKTKLSKIIQSDSVLGLLLSKIPGPLMKVAVPLAKKYFSSIRNNSSSICSRCRNWTENTWFWTINSNNFKWRNEWHNENCWSS